MQLQYYWGGGLEPPQPPTPVVMPLHSNNSLAIADELSECVQPSCGVGA